MIRLTLLLTFFIPALPVSAQQTCASRRLFDSVPANTWQNLPSDKRNAPRDYHEGGAHASDRGIDYYDIVRPALSLHGFDAARYNGTTGFKCQTHGVRQTLELAV